MTKFFSISIYSKNPVFGRFSQFWGRKQFLQKCWLCHEQLRMGFQYHAKIQKRLVKNAQTNGRTDGLPANAGGPMTTTIIIHNNNKKIHLICILQSQTCQEDRRTKKNFCEKDLFLGILKKLLPARILTFVGRNCD